MMSSTKKCLRGFLIVAMLALALSPVVRAEEDPGKAAGSSSAARSDSESTESVDTELLNAAAKGNAERVRQLLDRGAQIETRDTEQGGTPLLWSSAQGHASVVRVLLEKGGDANAKTKTGWNPLLLACAKGHTEIVKLFLEKGADVDARASEGLTAFSIAAKSDNADLMKILVEHCASLPWGEATVNKVDTPGQCLIVRQKPAKSSTRVGCVKIGEKLVLNGLWSENNWINVCKPCAGWIPAEQIDTGSLPREKRAVLSFGQPNRSNASTRSGQDRRERGDPDSSGDFAHDPPASEGPSGPRRQHGWR